MAEPNPDKMAVTVDNNTTNQTVRDSVFDEVEHNAQDAGHTSVVDNLPKKKSTFKITSVTQGKNQSHTSQRSGSGEPLTDADHDADVDSTDDLDESRTEDFSSEMLDSSKTTDFDQDVTDDTTQNLTPEVELIMIKDVKEKSDYSRFKVVKIETTNPIRRGRWTCQDYLDAVREKSDTKVAEETRSGNSSAGSSVHYVPGVDDPAKNPLSSGSSGGVPASQIVENLAQTITPDVFQPIQPATNPSQQTTVAVGTSPGTIHLSGATPISDQSSPVAAFQPQSLPQQGQLTEQNTPIDKIPPQQQNVSQIPQSLQPAASQSIQIIPQSNTPGQTIVSQPQQVNLAATSSHSQSSHIQPSTVPGGVQSHVVDQGPVIFPHTSQQSTHGHDTQGTVANIPTSGGVTTQLPGGTVVDLVSQMTGSVSIYQPVVQNQSIPSDTNTLQPSTVSSVIPSGAQIEVTSNKNKEDTATSLAVTNLVPVQKEASDVDRRKQDLIQITDLASVRANIDMDSVMQVTSPLLTPLVEAVGGISSPTKENSDAGGLNSVAIDNKIEQAMDLVKSHLMYAVREEVEVLKEQIKELMEKNSQLEYENSILKAAALPETLALLSQPRPQPPSSSS